MNVQEFNIPVPWGSIAVKAWGEQYNKPVLVTHGRTDNAGSFDRLIPLLPNNFYYICIDLPSHGRSSHLPPFFPIHFLNFVVVYKLVLDYLKRRQYIFLGHSFGAGVGNYFARYYPEYVEKVIEIDTFSPMFPAEKFKHYLTLIFESVTDSHQKEISQNKRVLTEEQAIELIRFGRWGTPLSTEAAKPLVKRILVPAGDGKFYVPFDRRLKATISPVYDLDYFTETLRLNPITCPYLLILCEKSSTQIPKIDAAIKQIRKWRNAKIHYVNAEHDVHITDPEVIAPVISQFLTQIEAKL